MLRGFSPQAALDAPRFCISAGSPDSGLSKDEGKTNDVNSAVYFEEGIPLATVEALRGALFSIMISSRRFSLCSHGP